MGEVIPFERNPRSAGTASANLAAQKKETWGSAFANSAFLNVPAFARANRGEKPQVITARNVVTDLGVHAAYLAALGPAPLVFSVTMGVASLARYQQKKKAA